MVDKISPTDPSASSLGVRVDNTLSITAEPLNTLVAHRQSEITERLEQKGEGGHGKQNVAAAEQSLEKDNNDPGEELLSGESKRIGTGVWDDDVPFGEHVGYL